MTRETGAKVIGLCHGFYGYRALAEAIGVPDRTRSSGRPRASTTGST